MKRFASALALSLLPVLAWAGDKEAIESYHQARKHWSDPDPAAALKYATLAVEQAESRKMKANALLLLGSLHQGKTGDFDAALDAYEQIIRSTIEVEDNTLNSLKAQALLGKGVIYYSEFDDLEAALSAYRAAHSTYPTARSADTLAQLCFRLGRDPAKSQGARDKQLEVSEELSREALHHDAENRNKTGNPARTAKLRLQLTIVLYAQGKADEAVEVWKQTDQEALNANSWYQLAILQTLQGEDAATVGATLRKALEPQVRPTPRARNQLRKFIRSEADFKPFRDEESWQDLVTDEPEEAKPTSRSVR